MQERGEGVCEVKKHCTGRSAVNCTNEILLQSAGNSEHATNELEVGHKQTANAAAIVSNEKAEEGVFVVNAHRVHQEIVCSHNGPQR